MSSDISFILCDGLAQGFLVHYVSQGFTALFGRSPTECHGQLFDRLIGAGSIPENDANLAELCKRTGLSRSEAQSSLTMLSQRIEAGLEKFSQLHTLKLDLSESRFDAPLVCFKKSGKPIVCNLVIQLRKLPRTNWLYLVGVQQDVSDAVTVEEVLRNAGAGEPLPTLQVNLTPLDAPEVSQLFDSAALEMYQSLGQSLFKRGKAMQDSWERQHSSGIYSCSTAAESASSRSGLLNRDKEMRSFESQQDVTSRLQGCEDLRSLPFALGIIDPSHQGYPVVALTDCLERVLLNEPNHSIGEGWNDLLSKIRQPRKGSGNQRPASAHDHRQQQSGSVDRRGTSFSSATAGHGQSVVRKHGTAGLGALDKRLLALRAIVEKDKMDGERLFLWSSGDVIKQTCRETMMILREVEIDDRTFLMGFTAMVFDGDDQEVPGYQAAYQALSRNADTASHALANQFWFCTALRRDSYYMPEPSNVA